MPAGGALTSPPRSNRIEASVFNPSRLLVRRTDGGWKYALSSTIRVVPLVDLRVSSAHHAGHRRGTLGVGDDEHVLVERALDAVERLQRLAGGRAPDHEPAAAEPRQVERVHRLAHLQHHVVGDVDDVVDGADAGGFEALGEPGGRGPDAHVEDLRAIPRAQRRLAQIDVDGNVAGRCGGCRRCLQRRRAR